LTYSSVPDSSTCVRTCVAPTNDMHGQWNVESTNPRKWHFDCDSPGYIRDPDHEWATPTAHCDDAIGIVHDTVPDGYCVPVSHGCSGVPRNDEAWGGEWAPNGGDTGYHYHCTSNVPSNPAPVARCDETTSTWVIHPTPTSGTCQPTPIDCSGSWSKWSACTVSCGKGSRSRRYTVSTPASNGGWDCPHEDGYTDTSTCNDIPCGSGGSDGDGSVGGSHDYNEEFIHYDSTQPVLDAYAVAFDDHTPINDINKQIYDFYKPTCSLHLDADNQTIMSNPGLVQLREYPGVGRCS
jgi:hypothetical protein